MPAATARSLKRSHRLFSGVGYYGNFIGSPVQIGDVFQVDEGEHILLGNISKLEPSIKIEDLVQESTEANFKFVSGKEFDIKFGANAELKLGKGEVQIEFKSNNSAFVSLNNARIEVLPLGFIEEQLKAHWQKKGYDKPGNRKRYIMISSIISAESGTVIFSQERNNRVVLKASTDEEVKSIKALGSGTFDYVSNTKATLEIISPNKIKPMYRAVWIRPNGRFDIVE